jgi:tRNA (guanine10-N2)-methyltransferase
MLFQIGEGQTHLKTKFALSNRRYIGNSTMDPELAFIQANLALTSPGSLALDPFCGTGLLSNLLVKLK